MTIVLDRLANTLGLGSLLQTLRNDGGYRLIDHWQQGEFHHDLVLEVDAAKAGVPGGILVVATNCNGGVKEVLCFGEVPARGALWSSRCPDVEEFVGVLPALLGQARTTHWFNPCELVADDARSELKPSCRRRAPGGGWQPA